MAVSNGRSSSSLFEWVFIAAFIVICSSRETTCNAEGIRPACTPSSCGNIRNISYPFRLEHDPSHCGNSMYTLFCENNVTVLKLHGQGKAIYVQEINYDNQTIRVVDPGIDNTNCFSLPPSDIVVSLGATPYRIQVVCSPSANRSFTDKVCAGTTFLTFLKCDSPLKSFQYVDAAPCFTSSSSLSTSQPNTYPYVYIGGMKFRDLKDGCSIEGITLAIMFDIRNASYKSIHDSMLYGFQLHYTLDPFVCVGQWSYNDKCYAHSIRGLIGLLLEVIRFVYARGILFDNISRWPFKPIQARLVPLIFIGLLCLARTIVGAPIVTAFLIYRWRRRHLSMYSTIEDFLQSDNNFLPIRYSYSEIKKMTSKFKDKLGEGGYGSVYKAKLRSGRIVAIKILGKAKGNGQDFTNEVATIGRIHHVNVVQLVGYCVEGSNRALVYDFMPNGSLDKYIYSKEGSIPLSYKKMYDISLGVAQGIEYLHQGCDMQILHFDIKPHNILLDDNFNAKVSDFGLAKLYPVENSIVSLTAARGTMGYIAPELFYKNIGGVSYKADVYSFGMLLMEMASRRKSWKEVVEHSSQTYFPLWAYDQYNEGNDLEMDDVTEEEKKLIRKMVITALWCIQMKPSERPSMNKVIEMLAGDVECLKMPSKPFLYAQEMHVGSTQNNINPVCSNAEMTWTLSAR